jgi:hypothetical protein
VPATLPSPSSSVRSVRNASTLPSPTISTGDSKKCSHSLRGRSPSPLSAVRIAYFSSSRTTSLVWLSELMAATEPSSYSMSSGLTSTSTFGEWSSSRSSSG